jgi:hypothetical protein
MVSGVAEELTAGHHADDQGGSGNSGCRQREPRWRPPAEGSRPGPSV